MTQTTKAPKRNLQDGLEALISIQKELRSLRSNMKHERDQKKLHEMRRREATLMRNYKVIKHFEDLKRPGVASVAAARFEVASWSIPAAWARQYAEVCHWEV